MLVCTRQCQCVSALAVYNCVHERVHVWWAKLWASRAYRPISPPFCRFPFSSLFIFFHRHHLCFLSWHAGSSSPQGISACQGIMHLSVLLPPVKSLVLIVGFPSREMLVIVEEGVLDFGCCLHSLGSFPSRCPSHSIWELECGWVNREKRMVWKERERGWHQSSVSLIFPFSLTLSLSLSLFFLIHLSLSLSRTTVWECCLSVEPTRRWKTSTARVLFRYMCIFLLPSVLVVF